MDQGNNKSTSSLSVPVLMVTANVGSIFEDSENMLPLWVTEFLNVVRDKRAAFIALHCQEIGGKNYEESMKYVSGFVKTLVSSNELKEYNKCRVYIDEHYEDTAKFTALGSLYFVHQSLTDVAQLDFKDNKFVQVQDREINSGNIEHVRTMEKDKFPKHYFPECKWSRKGYLRTRWKLNKKVFDFINIHLFHDASNLIAMEESPSSYSQYRYNALRYTLDRLRDDHLQNVPYFIFGDFNFRLDTHLFIQSVTKQLSVIEKRNNRGEMVQMTFVEEGCGGGVGQVDRVVGGGDQQVDHITSTAAHPLLTIGTKLFSLQQHEHIFRDLPLTTSKVLKYDKELDAFQDRVYEYGKSFPPSYPYVESIKDGNIFMRTRCPAWCDRVLISSSARQHIDHSANHQPQYNVIGSNVCMGDHKPVYLYLNLATSAASHSCPTASTDALIHTVSNNTGGGVAAVECM